VNTTLRPLYPRGRHGTHCIGSWVRPKAGQDGCGKISLLPGFDPWTVQPVASRYTDCANPAPRLWEVFVLNVAEVSEQVRILHK
jgi:hypothetical protein